ncbi:hypothetical protein YN1HA_18020 [Sulfurisphaera ohwakuensis]
MDESKKELKAEFAIHLAMPSLLDESKKELKDKKNKGRGKVKSLEMNPKRN